MTFKSGRQIKKSDLSFSRMIDVQFKDPEDMTIADDSIPSLAHIYLLS